MDNKEARIHNVIADVFQIRGFGPLPIGTPQKYGDRRLLPVLCSKLGHKKGAEIGVRTGAFSELFCKEIQELEMLCIDPWSPVPNYSQNRQDRHYKDAVERLGKYNVKLIKKTSMDALSDVEDRSLDFIHIDGRHEFDYVMLDLIHWCQKVRKHGIIALHDYHAGCQGVMHAINAYTVSHHIDPWYVLKATQPTAFWVNQ